MNVKWRSENYGGSGVRNLKEVIEYEMFELCNTDIPQYMLNHYEEEIKKMNYGNIFEYYANIFDDDINDAYFGKKESILKAISDVINKVAGKELKYALWLANAEEVKEIYAGDVDELIDAYDIDNAFIISDLGYDGALYCFEEFPKALELEDNIIDNLEIETER